MRNGLVTILLLLAVAPVRGAEKPLERILARARSQEEDRRRGALEALLADPTVVTPDDRKRVVRILEDVLTRDHEPEIRGLAALTLSRFRSRDSDLAILGQLVRETDFRAQRPMIAAMEGETDDAVLDFLVKGIYRDEDTGVRALLAEALGRSPTPRAGDELRRFSTLALDWPILSAVALALERHPERETIDRLIDLLWSEEPAVRAAAYESLVHVTNERALPADASRWVEWWAKHRATFAAPLARPARPGEVKTVAGELPSLPTYYDIPIRGRKVVFCLDVSASMWGPKIEAAKAELARAVMCLPSNYRFDVIYFNEHPHPWRPCLNPASPWQKRECIADFELLTTKMYTNIFDTLETALGFAGLGRWAQPDPPGVDDVFLVTDGEPNRGRFRDEKNILAGLDEIDPRHRVRIHTISVGDVPKELMTAIAAARGGTHVHVPAAR